MIRLICCFVILVGCGAPSPEVIPSAKSSPPSAPVAASEDTLYRLFAVTWAANNAATLAYAGNADADTDSLANYAWQNCIENKTRVFFKDAGLRWITERTDFLIELPVRSSEFAATIRVIDHYHFAYRDGKYWLVFRALDWEDDFYQPPTGSSP